MIVGREASISLTARPSILVSRSTMASWINRPAITENVMTTAAYTIVMRRRVTRVRAFLPPCRVIRSNADMNGPNSCACWQANLDGDLGLRPEFWRLVDIGQQVE